MKPFDSKKPIKSFFLFAIASYMLTQAALLVLGAAANFTAFPSLMHYHAFNGSNVLLSWNFSDDGSLSHMLMLWGLGTVMFVVIFWLFLHFGSDVELPPDADAPEQSGAHRVEPSAFAAEEDVPAAEAGVVGSVPQTVQPPAYSSAGQTLRPMPHATDDGTGLGVVALICGLIGFIPGLGLVFAIAAIICGAIGNMRASAVGNSAGRTLSIIGIALAAISLLLTVSTVVFLGSLFSALFGTMV